MAKAKAIAMSPEDQDWQAKNDMRTLMDAHAIKKDPKRHSAAKAKAKEHMAALQSIQQPHPAPVAAGAGAKNMMPQ